MPDCFQSTTIQQLRVDGVITTGALVGRGTLPGRLVYQHRYQKPVVFEDADEGAVSYETRLGLIVSVQPARHAGDWQVDVWWSGWAPSDEPEGLAARRRVRGAAQAHSAK